MLSDYKVEIITGTRLAVLGPHPTFIHVGECELFDPKVFAESRELAGSGLSSDLTDQQEVC